MRPPSYYNTLANANPSTSNRGGSTSQQLRSSFANSSSASYATRSHLPFVSQSMLVAHCYTGAGSTTKPYGHQAHLQRSSSPVGFSSASSLYSSPTSYSSSYTRPSSTASSRRPQLQHQSSFSGSYNSYSEPASFTSRGNAYHSSPATTKTTTSTYRAPPPRSSYLSSATLASLSTPHRVSAAASSSSSSSSSYQRRPLATTSYYKPIRLRERPLLTQISRQLNTRYTPSIPSSRVPSVRQGDDGRATPYTQPPGGATSRAQQSSSLCSQSQQTKSAESEKEIEEKWSSDVARNISRNKYIIKFREFDKRASIVPAAGESLPRPKDLTDPIELLPRLAAPTVTPATPTTPPPLDSLLGGQSDQQDRTGATNQSEQLLAPNSSYNSSSSNSNHCSSSSRDFVENNTDSKETKVEESISNNDEVKLAVQKHLDEQEEAQKEQPVRSENPDKFLEQNCVEKSAEEKPVEGSVDNSKSREAPGKKQAAAKKTTGKKVLVKKKGELKEKLVAGATTSAGQVVVDRRATLEKTIDQRTVEKGVEKPALKLSTTKAETTVAKESIEQQTGDKKKPSEEGRSAIVKAALEPVISTNAAKPKDSLAEQKMKQQADCDKAMPIPTTAKSAPTQASPEPPVPGTTPKPAAPPAPSQVNGTGEPKKAPAERVIRLRLKAGAKTGVCSPLKQTNASRSGQIENVKPKGQQPPQPQPAPPAPAAVQLSNSIQTSPVSPPPAPINKSPMSQSQAISKTPSSPTINKTSPIETTNPKAKTTPVKTNPQVTEVAKAPEAPEATPTATTPTSIVKPKVKKLIIKKKAKLEDGETQEKPATRRRESNASSGAGSPKKAKTKVKLATNADRKVLGEKQCEENNIAEKTNNKMVVAGSEPTNDTQAVESNNKQVETPKTPRTPKTPETPIDGLALNRPANKRIKFREYNIDDFNFLSVLGHGGWGFVILAELKEHDACFAVKCIKKITIVEDDDFDSIMIERKMLTLGNVNPFICKLFCTFETDGYLFFVMEYCAGGDLMFHVQKEAKFSEPRCRFYAAEIICAIRFLHNRHIIYRDLKLDNILLDSKGHVRLVDFGMCQLRTYREEMLPSNFCGTPEYISPEIIKGVPYNHSVDWWSFGVLLYEMAVGKMPFRGNDENELLWNVCYEQIHYPMFLTKELTSLLQSLLEREPTKRMGMATCKAGDIYDQPWFKGVDWKATEEMRVKPPFVPEVTSNRDVRNFDDDFTQSAPELSPIDEETLQKIDQSQFQKFPYTNPDIFIFN